MRKLLKMGIVVWFLTPLIFALFAMLLILIIASSIF